MIVLAVFVALLQAGAAQPSTPVRYGITVQPDTVTVGQHFTVTVRVRAPRGWAMAFPAAPDSGGPVEALDPRTVVASPDTSALDETARYALAAWDTGTVRLPLGSVRVTSGGATQRQIALNRVSVYVQSVLPADTALRKPKPARDILAGVRPWWPWLLAALVALLLLLLLLWWLRRRRRPAVPVPLAPFEQAQREFARIEALRLLEAGERGRYVALTVGVVRDYLAQRVESASRSLTSTELLRALSEQRHLAAEGLAPALAEADLIKFARRPVTTERARDLGLEFRTVVRAVEQSLTPVPEDRAA
ncbi:MAG TPA: hypothetical protein VFW98_10210 [Gemmatimonadaceae bacterium]|nr:hypothetical protein [Gemmatimonadaceae bacterium]